MSKNYVKMVITPVGFELRSSVLTGSLTKTSVKINAVEVEEFDAGFNSGLGYENDFQEISFD